MSKTGEQTVRVLDEAYKTIRSGAPGLSDQTCNVLAGIIARKVSIVYAHPHPSQQAGTEGSREIAARAVYAARPVRYLHPEERDITWDEAQTECPDRIATIYRDVDAILALFPRVAGWRPIDQDTPTDGPSFLVCTNRRNVYVAYRRSDEEGRFLHFASGLAREINEEIWGWQPNPEPLPAAPDHIGETDEMVRDQTDGVGE